MKQFSIFDQPENTKPLETLNDLSLLLNIKGLQYIPQFVTNEEQDGLWKSVNEEKWLGDLKRRVQHYGYKYDYKARFIDYSMRIGDLPDWALAVAQKLKSHKIITDISDQLIVNEYEPGQGIADHIDCEPCFGDTVCSLSLGSACVMNFINKDTKEKVEVLLEPGSLVVLKEEARYNWTHGITARKTDSFQNTKIARKTRISLTFRNIILNS